MKATELMIGDLVKYTSKYSCGIGKVVGIEPREGTYPPTTFTIIPETNDSKSILLIGVSKYNIEPIPLTQEILEKTGFILNTHVYPYPVYDLDDSYMLIRVAFPEGKSTKYRVPFVEIDTKNCFVEHIEIKYVHELQHALKLCGIDKEIEL